MGGTNTKNNDNNNNNSNNSILTPPNIISQSNLKEERTKIEPKIMLQEEKALDKEFNRLKSYEQIQKCQYMNKNKKHWKIVLRGMDNTPYEDGFFILELLFNKGVFPQYGPEAKFITKMFHPNVNEDGHICINILNEWNPKRTMIDVITGIEEIMVNPIPDGGYSNEAKKLLETNKDDFYKKVEEYTYTYAMNGF